MNFSKKNHEYKIINIKRVSKKIILSIVFVVASITMMDANSNAKNDICEDYVELDIKNSISQNDDCFGWAWEIGSEYGNGDTYLEWYYTNMAYNICEATNKIMEQMY